MSMRKLFPLTLIAAIGLAACRDMAPEALTASGTPPPGQGNAPAAGQQTIGRYLVVFTQERIPSDIAARVEALGGKVELTLDALGVATVSGLDGTWAKALAGTAGIAYVEPEALAPGRAPELPLNAMRRAAAPARQLTAARLAAAPLGAWSPTGASLWPQQWDKRAIEADRAWAAGHLGSSAVTVAILGGGIGYTHPDLEGLVDLQRSVSFIPEDDELIEIFFPPGTHPVADLGGISTHAAATVSSNAVHAAGVTSGTTLMGVKVCGLGGSCPYGAIFAGIEHAVDNGADIILMSLYGLFYKRPNPYQEEPPGFVAVLNRAINYANKNNVLVVVPAGDYAIDLDHSRFEVPGLGTVQTPTLYSAFCNTPHTLCVSATGPSGGAAGVDVDAFAPYSNYGRSVINVAAPGGNSGGGVVAACSPFYLGYFFPPKFEPLPGCVPGETSTVAFTGTIAASAHVAGLAAMVVSKYGNNPAQVRSRIEKYADPMGESGNDPYYGKGRINVYRTMTGK